MMEPRFSLLDWEVRDKPRGGNYSGLCGNGIEEEKNQYEYTNGYTQKSL